MNHDGLSDDTTIDDRLSRTSLTLLIFGDCLADSSAIMLAVRPLQAMPIQFLAIDATHRHRQFNCVELHA